MAVVKEHKRCRVCDAELPEPYLDLGCQPLANALLNRDTAMLILPPGVEEERGEAYIGGVEQYLRWNEYLAPLAVTLCTQCGLSQLTVVVDPEVLYSGYRFRSGASEQWADHCDKLALDATLTFGAPGLVLDIAANDGTQLAALKRKGWRTAGVEPAIIEPVEHVGRIERTFWGWDVARMLRYESGPFDLVIAQNVLGHVDKPVEFLAAVEHVLAPDGLLVVEVPHVRDMILGTAFDTIYHEHLSYWSTPPLRRAARMANLELHRTDNLFSIHGGSRRYWFKRQGGRSDREHPQAFVPRDVHPYKAFANDVERRLTHVMRVLQQIEKEELVLGAYGASAKGAVMLNTLKSRGNTVWPVSIVDDVKEKQGMLSPGVHIPIVSPEDSGMIEWDVCWCLSWNWSQQLKQRARAHGFRGEWFVTHPRVERG